MRFCLISQDDMIISNIIMLRMERLMCVRIVRIFYLFLHSLKTRRYDIHLKKSARRL